MTSGLGSAEAILSSEEVREIVAAALPENKTRNKRILVLTPDTTRTCPLPEMVKALHDVAGSLAARLDFMVALGTHTPLAEEKILELYGIDELQLSSFANTSFLNHRWDLDETMTRIGWIEAEEIEHLSGGRLKERVPVDINRAIFDYDLIVICGPVFPHEVVGYSGGAKYLFPGISGGEFLHAFHWLGAVVTCAGTIGIKHTPVREVINRAMELIDTEVLCLSMVVKSQSELYGLYAGDYKEAWSAAADLSEQVHVVEKEQAYPTVFGVCPPMYNEIWTGGKVMYKLEQVVADGGKLIIYAPHITEVSRTWGTDIERIGYHIVDYFLEQPGKFSDIPRGVLAHSTHVRGTGVMKDGIEQPRIEVVIASQIPPETCAKISLGYLDPDSINPDEFKNREAEGVLFVEKAGEILHRVKKSR
ncbi:MAG: lactate racemase domain-containing protein [Desulfocapsaceae bacterium]